MIQGLLGRKIGMSRWFDKDGNSVSVTLISCGPCYVVDKTKNRIQIGYEVTKESSLNKPKIGYFKKKKVPFLKYIKHVSWCGKEEDQPQIGDKIYVDEFKIGEKIDVQGKSKGKGFSGVIKRWGFKGGPASHGSRSHRIHGSIGQSSDPSRVWPGMKMAGRKGGKNVTVSGLEVMNMDKNENIIFLRGAVPGPKKNVLFLKRSIKEINKRNGSQ